MVPPDTRKVSIPIFLGSCVCGVITARPIVVYLIGHNTVIGRLVTLSDTPHCRIE